MASRSRCLLAGALAMAVAAASTGVSAQPFDLEGARAGQAEGSLQSRGYRLDHTSGGNQYWWNGGRNECISLYVDDGRYRDVRSRGAGDCNVYGSRKKDNTGAIVAGALAIGILAAAAASSKKKHDDDRYDDDRYDGGRSYSPARGVDCYTAQRACYERGSGYSAYWTRQEFKYRY